jgi:DNA-binding NarL/FixJ family response regulator
MARMRRAGACGYLVKGAAPDDLIELIERIRA